MQTYEDDVVAWANEQARLLRTGRFDLLDIEHIAEEIEDVGKSEQRELANRMAVLLTHLLKWHYQPERRELGKYDSRTAQGAGASTREDPEPARHHRRPRLVGGSLA